MTIKISIEDEDGNLKLSKLSLDDFHADNRFALVELLRDLVREILGDEYRLDITKRMPPKGFGDLL